MTAKFDLEGYEVFGGLLYKYIPFNPREIEGHLAIYMIQCFNLAPQLKMKLKSQSTELNLGHHLIFRCIGKNFENTHRFSHLDLCFL